MKNVADILIRKHNIFHLVSRAILQLAKLLSPNESKLTFLISRSITDTVLSVPSDSYLQDLQL